MKDYKLCYMERVDDWNTFKLYFTDNYENQWGDDWNDRPADSNAGEPYDEDSNIITLYAEFSWLCNDIIFGGKTYAVVDMNKSGVPWLIFKDKDYNDYTILGGSDFVEVLTTLEISGVVEYWFDKETVDYLIRDYESNNKKAIDILSSLEG